MAERVLAGLAVVPFLLGAAAAPADHQQVAFSFQDERITESSGLVALPDGLFVTTNDSGDEARVFTVDARGRTVGVTTWADDADDVEALAPAGPDEVWVADIGDNRRGRDSVRVARVPVGEGDRDVTAPAFELVYPDGPHDAETLLAAPDGRLYVVTKGFLGGTVYAAPAPLSSDRPNRLQPLGAGSRLLPMATDGAFLPDGRHVVVRGYTNAVVYAFPTFDRVGGFALPSEQQGEGLAVAADGTLYLSSEGLRSDVLRLPASTTSTATGASGPASPAGAATGPADPTTASTAERPAATARTHHPWWPWALLGLVGAAVVGLQLRFLRSR